MREHRPSSYPVRVVSRSAAKKRSTKVRMAWFVVGTSFGILCTSALTSPTLPIHTAIASPAPVPELAPVVTAQALLPQPVVVNNSPLPPALVDAPSQAVALVDAKGKEIDNQQADALMQEPEPVAIAKAPTVLADPLSLELKVENGDTLSTLLADAGVTQEEAFSAVEAMRKVFDPKKLDIGQKMAVELTPHTEKSDGFSIKSLILPVSATSFVELTRGKDNRFTAKALDIPVERKLARAGGRIDSSLYETVQQLSIPNGLMSEVINAYSYDVDFQRDIKRGDQIEIVYERLRTKDGKPAGYGNIIYAELNLGERMLKVYRYVDQHGNADYYNEKGESVRKALLKTPISGARMTSGYGMRTHPVMGYSKMHRGVDFGAPQGTPIYAAGDGTVDFVGRKGGYGNYIKVKHNDKYASAYAHISRFASGMVPGRKVKQGQIIAYVGSTGMSTGPHLHYEILVAGEQVNPSNVKFKTGAVLKGTELASFRKSMEQIEAMRATMPRDTSIVAMADTQSDAKN